MLVILSKSSLVAFGFSAQLYFVPPFPSLLCLGWVTTDHPRIWVISVFVCLWAVVTATGLVPFHHSPLSMVVLVACTPLVVGPPCGHLPVLSGDWLFLMG